MKATLGLSAALLVLGGNHLTLAAGPGRETSAAFERLKQLVGSWTMSVPGAPPGEDLPPGSMVRYQMTAGGSALVETQFVGQPHEMTTVYHLDGADLVLTHYCAAGNQPRMRLRPSGDPATLEFRFTGGSNIEPGVTPHMHEARLTWIDEDHVRAEWTLWDKGKKGEIKRFEMRRVPKAS